MLEDILKITNDITTTRKRQNNYAKKTLKKTQQLHKHVNDIKITRARREKDAQIAQT
jgi:hypothetical protein